LLIDAVHYAPHFLMDVEKWDTDFLICSAYKFYAPHVGILYSRPGLLDKVKTDRLVTVDDTAPYKIETGTLNTAAIAGVKAGIEYIASWGAGTNLREKLVSAYQQISAHEHEIASYYYENVKKIPGVTVYGVDFSSPQRAPTVSITLDKIPADTVSKVLGGKGICVWQGDFYAWKVVEILGKTEQGLLRVGISMYTTKSDIDRLLAALTELSASLPQPTARL